MVKVDQVASARRDDILIVRHKQVRQKLQVSSAKLFDMVAKGIFPPPFQLIPGGRAVGWLESDVDRWILARKNAYASEHLQLSATNRAKRHTSDSQPKRDNSTKKSGSYSRGHK